jgi:hypothetical protein
MALHRWERFLRVSFSMFLIFCKFFDHIFGISTIDFIQKASLNVQFRGPLIVEDELYCLKRSSFIKWEHWFINQGGIMCCK